MTNDQLNQIKIEVNLISKDISQMVHSMSDLAKSMDKIDDKEQPEEFQEAAILYSQSNNQLTTFLLTVADSLSLTLLNVIKDIQSSPKAKLWVP